LSAPVEYWNQESHRLAAAEIDMQYWLFMEAGERLEHVAVLGLGYVGCVTAACLAELGHNVVGVDTDGFKVQSILDGTAPFYEPGLDDLIRRGRAAGRLTASRDLAAVLPDCDLALICVGTPSARNGSPNLQYLTRVVDEIATVLAANPKPFIVAIRSTVFPGTCEEFVIPRFSAGAGISVVSNPEFMREGSAVQDFLTPSLLVIGGSVETALYRVAQLYARLPVPPSLVSLRTAELIKYACNAFHAVKVTFANEIGAVANALGIPAREVMETFCKDTVLNLSPAYLKPGFAFGGSCLPKDLRALVHRAGQSDLSLPLLQAVLPSNDQQIARAIRSILDLPFDRIGVFGLAFKENTDDLRESPVVTMLETLIGKGRNVRVFDPHIQLNQIYGSNQRFLLSAIPHIGKLLDSSLEEMLRWAECVVTTLKADPEASEKIRAAGLPVLDLAYGRALPG